MAAKYLIIARELERRLRQNGDSLSRLPTEAALCEEYSCSRQTVRSALAVLEEKGLIVRRQGSGSYAAHTPQKGSRQIAVVIPDREEYLYPALLRDIRKAAEDAGCTVSVMETSGSREQEREHLTRLLREHPAGIILEPIADVLGCFCEDVLSRIRAAQIPLVTLNGSYSPVDPCIRGDDAAAAGTLMAYLSAMGHRHVAAFLKSDDSRGIRRYQGSVRGAAESGIQLESCLWYSEAERQRLLDGDDRLLRRFLECYRLNCSAVVCQNDEIAFRLLRLLRSERIDMAVVSFDNSYLALSRDAQLTSLGFRDSLPGTVAVHTLLHFPTTPTSFPAPLPMALNVRKSG